jgi:hypothetical protein
MTILKAINVFLLQWFFIRLTKHQSQVVENYKLTGFDYVEENLVSSSGTGKIIIKEWYSIQYCIIPLTGWWSNYVFLTKEAKFKPITKKIIIKTK